MGVFLALLEALSIVLLAVLVCSLVAGLVGAGAANVGRHDT